MTRRALLLIAGIAAGCGAASDRDASTPEPSTLVEIQSIVADQLGLRTENVSPDLTFGAIGADDLDLVEITMDVEDKFGIAIHDDALVDAAGAKDANSLCDLLTIRTFASVAEKAPKQAEHQKVHASDDGTLRESQVGLFEELSQLPNPDGHVLVFIPSVEELTELQEQRLGRKLDGSEIEVLRQKAVVIALPRKIADKVKQRKPERIAPDGNE